MQTAAVVGAGIVGRTLALELYQKGIEITLFDQGMDLINPGGASYQAGGMISPIAELESCEVDVFNMGENAVQQWKDHISRHDLTTQVYQNGAIVFAHPRDHSLLGEFHRKITRKLTTGNSVRWTQSVADFIPFLQSWPGLMVTAEGHLNPRELMATQGQAIHNSNIHLELGVRVTDVNPYKIKVNNISTKFDLVCDCRGLGAADGHLDLRPVKGEAIILTCPEIQLTSPLRLLHPRHPIYLVPRGEDKFYVGATSIETQSLGVSVQSALELLSVATTISPRFLQASIDEIVFGYRPATTNHLPIFHKQAGLIAINGLYRHGFLLTPYIVSQTIAYLEAQKLLPT